MKYNKTQFYIRSCGMWWFSLLGVRWSPRDVCVYPTRNHSQTTWCMLNYQSS